MPNIKRYAKDPRTQAREETAQSVYDFVVQYEDERRYSPSLDEISQACYLSRAAVTRYLDLLEARGYIERQHNIPRSIRIVPHDERTS